MSIFHEKWKVRYMTKEEFINHLLEVKVVLEKLAKKQEVYDENVDCMKNTEKKKV